MTAMPRDKSFDSTLAMLGNPYGFIAERCQRRGTDVFETRLLLRKTICMTGSEAAQLFYDESRFMRRGAAPRRIRKTLFGLRGVQGLDGEPHRHRKHMLMSLMTPERIDRLAEHVAEGWRKYAAKWRGMPEVPLYEETCELLTRAVCDWAGVPLLGSEVGRRARDLKAMFDHAGAVGPRYWHARRARKRAEAWIADVIDGTRSGRLRPPEGSALHVVARHRDLNRKLLPPRVAAVELLNLLRPTVAVAVYVVAIAHALEAHPECREQLQDGSSDYPALFVQEVRRFYPFFPAVLARVKRTFTWRGMRFPRGRRVMLDLHGINHDVRLWDAPEAFWPERFRAWTPSPFTFVPQGGGDHDVGHRCAGEWLTIALMQQAARVLARDITYTVPSMDLRMDRGRLPALPRSRFIIADVETRRVPKLRATSPKIPKSVRRRAMKLRSPRKVHEPVGSPQELTQEEGRSS